MQVGGVNLHLSDGKRASVLCARAAQGTAHNSLQVLPLLIKLLHRLRVLLCKSDGPLGMYVSKSEPAWHFGSKIEGGACRPSWSEQRDSGTQ